MSSPRFTVEPSVSNHFAWLRTRLGMERTLMAWIRTSIALIGFGFTIVQFFQRLQTGLTPDPKQPIYPQAPRDLGLALIGSGIFGLLVSIFQYHWGLRYLWQEQFRAIAGTEVNIRRTPAFWAAIVLIPIGLFAFASVFFHLG